MNKNNVYVFSKLSKLDCMGVRLGGAGLGNILFPWARAVIYAEKNNLLKINTTWRSLKVGPLLRGELDTRGYSDLFDDNNISGIKKFILLVFGKRILEKYSEGSILEGNRWPILVIFTGMKNQMQDILHDSQIVKKELINITRKKNLEEIEVFDGKGISIHIRMGDFYTPASEDEIRAGKTNCRLPIEWYISVIEKIRTNVGHDVQVNVFSDGTDDELRKIMLLKNIKRHYYGSAIADMLALSKSEVLIVSNSTFSLWASYLGRMPTIWFPGTLREKLYDNEIFEGEIDYTDDIPKKLLDYFQSHFTNKG